MMTRANSISIKRGVFCLVFMFFACNLFSQVNQVREPGIVYYKMNYYSEQINSELHFNNSKSLFIYNKIGMDSLQRGKSMQMSQKNEKIVGVSAYVPPIDEIGNLTYRNFSDKELILRFPHDSYVVQDNWLPIKWTIMEEYRNILGFESQKAIGQFRGRIYIAWFTRKIPVPYGPWKLFGLPGLILEAYDTANIAVFKVEKICYPCNERQVELDKPYEKEEKTMKEYVYIHDYSMEMFVVKSNKAALKVGRIGFFTTNQWTQPQDVKKSRKRKFEIIYEWEDYPGDTPSPFEKSLTEIALEICIGRH